MSGPDVKGSDVKVEMGILVIDDEPEILESLGNFLKGEGHKVYTAAGGEEGLELLRREAVDIVITDVQMPHMDGFEVMREVRRLCPGTEVIVITGYNQIENSFRAVQEGAFDYFTKPLKVENIELSIRRTVRFQVLRRERSRAQERLDRIGAEARERYGLPAIVGNSPVIGEVKDQIRKVCQADVTTVLVCGETGTGKELVARAIHSESARVDGPFVTVDCSAVPDTLFESAFYGHEKGAFTDARESRIGYFEQADGGTLFLDEIGDMAPEMQVKLLRTLEQRTIRRVGGSREIPVDVRVVSATNRNLLQAVAEGRFREDLFYRLNVFTIRVPALRERPEDILPLAQDFLEQYARELRKSISGFAPDAEALVRGYPFRGNVRELKNLVERAAILCGSGQVTAGDLRFDGTAALEDSSGGGSPAPCEQIPSGPPSKADLERIIGWLREEDLEISAFEKLLVREALRRCGGNQVHAAKLLNISRMTLRSRMRKYRLRAEDFQLRTQDDPASGGPDIPPPE